MPKISNLPAATSATLADRVAAVQGAITKRETLSQIMALFSSNITIAESQVTGLIADLAARLEKAENLADLDDVPTARTNLGLGTAATKDVSDDNEASVPSLAAGAYTIGNVPVFKDAFGTIEDSGVTPSGFDVVGQARGATTANLAGYTYANGAAGVGATLTAGGNGAFTSDGIAWLLGDRVLVKNQTSQLENGLYDITQLGDGSNPAILERSTIYDQPSEIIKGSIILVAEGTVNAQTSWMQVNDVAMVGADAIAFQQFTANPSTFLIRANNLSDLTNVATARNNLGVSASSVTMGRVIRQYFTGNGTYTPTSGMLYALVECVGGGGGGGGIGGGTAGTARSAGGGGGGEYAASVVTAAAVGVSQAVTIGTGGGGGAVGNNNGNNGNPTSVGSLVVANGGSFGAGGAAGVGGAGGTGGTGDLRIPGGNGWNGESNAIVSVFVGLGMGGDSHFSGRQNTLTTNGNVTGQAGKAYGGGGSGGATFNTAAGALGGGAGANGIVVITEFCTP